MRCEGIICPPLTLNEPAVIKVAPIITIVSVFIRVSKQPGVIVRLRRMTAQEAAGLSFGSPRGWLRRPGMAALRAGMEWLRAIYWWGDEDFLH